MKVMTSWSTNTARRVLAPLPLLLCVLSALIAPSPAAAVAAGDACGAVGQPSCPGTAPLPSFAYVERTALAPLVEEAEGVLDDELAAEEVLEVATWVTEAAEKSRSLLLVLDGDL